MKWIGTLLVIFGCGGCGFAKAAGCRREVRLLEQMLGIIEFMECELRFHQTNLPDLCKKIASQEPGVLGKIFFELERAMESQVSADVACCLDVAMSRQAELPETTVRILKELGRFLGRFDLEGQLQQLSAVKAQCGLQLEELRSHKDVRIRNYQTLSLCAGAALAILFF